MFAPEFTYKKCPWWHKLFKRFTWFKCWRCGHIKFTSVKLPIINAEMPSLNLELLAGVQPLTKRISIGIERGER